MVVAKLSVLEVEAWEGRGWSTDRQDFSRWPCFTAAGCEWHLVCHLHGVHNPKCSAHFLHDLSWSPPQSVPLQVAQGTLQLTNSSLQSPGYPAKTGHEELWFSFSAQSQNSKEFINALQWVSTECTRSWTTANAGSQDATDSRFGISKVKMPSVSLGAVPVPGWIGTFSNGLSMISSRSVPLEVSL